MFSHQVHLDITNMNFFRSWAIRIMFVWAVLCLTMYPLTGKMGLGDFVKTLPYWIPAVSFISMLYTQWDIEMRLLSVAKLVEKDTEWAGDHVKNSFFLRDYIAEEAAHKIRKRHDGQQPAPKLKTAEYIFEITALAEEMSQAHSHDEEVWRKNLKKSASRTIWGALSPSYWATQILYYPYLVDKQAHTFHRWFLGYRIFSGVLLLILMFLTISTIMTLMNMQGFIKDLPFNWIDWMTSSPPVPNLPSTAAHAGHSGHHLAHPGGGFIQIFRTSLHPFDGH